MAKYSVWILEALNISVSGGKSLDGITQGDGSHLPGETITLENGNWLETSIKDNDRNFDDNDNQRLQGDQTINGTNYGNNTKVEAEYSLTLQDPDTGETYEAVSYNVNDSSPAYGTVEGLAFLGPPQGWPPVGKPLNVIDAREGPGSFGQPSAPVDDFVVPCFLPGTRIAVPGGACAVESLAAGDPVLTMDAGARNLRAVLRTPLSRQVLSRAPHLAAVEIAPGAFGHGRPARTLRVSAQHCLLLSGWRAELMFALPEVLVPAGRLVDGRHVRLLAPEGGLEYIHLVFDRHHIIWAEGLATESYLPGTLTAPFAVAGLPAMRPARPRLRGWEARLLSPRRADATAALRA